MSARDSPSTTREIGAGRPDSAAQPHGGRERVPRPQGLAARAAFDIIAELRAQGHEAYVAGGAVRDIVLGVAPADYDVATSARPEQVMAIFDRTVGVGARFGVVIVHHLGAEVEVATFRSDGAYRDGRHPTSVVFTSATEDVARRDFTINGLLYDPEAEQVLDYVAGLADLRDKVVRCIGDPRARFEEDRLRMLRAVRFEQRLGFRMHPETEDALRHGSDHILEVSAERIRDELLKMLLGPSPDRALWRLYELGLLQPILPEVAALRGVEQSPPFHPEGDVLVHTARALASLEVDPALPGWEREALVMATLLHDVGKPATRTVEQGRARFLRHASVGAEMAHGIAQRLRLARRQAARLRALVADHDRIRRVAQMRRSRQVRLLRQPHAKALLALHRADCLAGNGDLSSWEAAVALSAALPPEDLRPPRLLDGHDLMAMGVAPGPELGRLLEGLEDAQIEGKVKARAEAEAWVRAALGAKEHER